MATRSRTRPQTDSPTSRSEVQATDDLSIYVLDVMQRSVLFMDTLLDRGNAYRAHLDQGTPALLKFEHELVLDGASLAEPCNYALLHIKPPAGMPDVNPESRPLIVVDPRAGHGPGIGGFKHDSEVGVAMRAGHPVYFVTFRPQPVDGQTLFSVMHAEAQFLEAVIALHPRCPFKPVVIGNCQAGWAMIALNATRPELFGPLMVVGAPISYWAGGSTLNPMRYSGAALGGSWLASFTSDLGADRFDGAYLVENFEKLNPANTLWSRYYKLWSNVDSEAARFLEFERWWGGYFRMTGSEIETIVENLFIGNRLARGELMDGNTRIDLRNITAPIVVFASHGDNITPVPQALDWIIDTWGDERAIAAAGRTIIYVLHESVGHLGIFVGGEIARKEHDQLVTSLDVIESLPPGLYEMKLQAKVGLETQRWDQLEPGDYTVHYEHRTMNDIVALNPEGRKEEELFSTIAQVSGLNASFYKTWIRPWVKMLATREVGDAIGKLHALRLQRELISDTLPIAPIIREMAKQARAQRTHANPDSYFSQMEKQLDTRITDSLNDYRDKRDAQSVELARCLYGKQGLGFWFKPDEPDAGVAHARAQIEIEQARKMVLKTINRGGVPEAVCRIVVAGMVSIGSFERRSLRLARLLSQLPKAERIAIPANANWVQLLKEQTRIAAVAPVEALNALEHMLPDAPRRELALAIAAAVMMIEPTLSNPRSEIIEFLIGTLGVEPERVISLAKLLTDSVDQPAASKIPAKTAAKPKAARATK